MRSFGKKKEVCACKVDCFNAGSAVYIVDAPSPTFYGLTSFKNKTVSRPDWCEKSNEIPFVFEAGRTFTDASAIPANWFPNDQVKSSCSCPPYPDWWGEMPKFWTDGMPPVS